VSFKEFHLLKDVLSLRIRSIDQPKSGHVGEIVPEVIQIDRFQVLQVIEYRVRMRLTNLGSRKVGQEIEVMSVTD